MYNMSTSTYPVTVLMINNTLIMHIQRFLPVAHRFYGSANERSLERTRKLNFLVYAFPHDFGINTNHD